MPNSQPLPINHIIRLITSSAAQPVSQPLTDTDWDDLTITAIALGLAPLLHWRLVEANLPTPPPALAKLALTRQAHAKRNEAIGRQTAELLAACARQQLEVIVLKGALLAPTVYPEMSLRPMNDIDLLFRPEDLPRVDPLLTGLGYEGKHKTAEQGPGITKHLSTYRRVGGQADTPNPYLSAGGDRTVEPHGSLEESWFGLKVDITPGVWSQAVPVTLYGQPARRLATSDLLLHLSVHAAFHAIMGSTVFVQLYDIGQVIKTWPDELDWAQLAALARQSGAQSFVYAGLYWASALYHAPIPATTLAALAQECQPGLVAYVKSLDAAAIFRRTQQPPLTSLPQRLRRGLADRRETARWAATPGQKWQVWQTALAAHKTDTAQLLLKKSKTAS